MTTGSAITGEAAGVPFTALPPAGGGDERAPLVVTWHMMDAPSTHGAFAAALPLTGVRAWRVHLGLPWCGERALPGGEAAVTERIRRDAVLDYADPVTRQGAEEFPAALAALRARFPVDEGPIGLVGGSLGGGVALRVLTGAPVPVAAVALVNPAIRARSVAELVETDTGRPHPWTERSREAADRLDFVARAGDIAALDPAPALLVVSGELDHAGLRRDADELTAALRGRYADPGRVRLASIPGLGHPLAERPGKEPAPQLPVAERVEEVIAEWFTRHPPGPSMR
ncbi:prolyl oligopeptidase family serine peptidase [Streptomyces sp. PT12]|uniref:prolyl oligopeptidase family serine peptidase n=1 Tax=Streptomyces sp. PT12 TaxID=1510197 RepID=UPI000DE2DBA4|nr:prolyl oligopeptidase family serine peptidase [Streptomyces sp. PT12]RBM22066.1 alpha/beta hydrolase [Streptomyces sp. PT12]